ncbi:GEgh16 protein [Pestalotiopsis sp. NC0098]|nr:GEgh16 protein [Pestalotiopsis sp. NC0098]
MPSFLKTCFVAPALLAVAHAQGVIQQAQGEAGPASLPLQVDLTKADANVINTAEITSNVVNECGRTLLAGNIDVGENTENQLIAKTVTQVTAGSNVTFTIAELNTDGAGPYTCDLDEAGNIQGATGQRQLAVAEQDSQAGTITLVATLPDNLKCIGASTGDVCTIRCFNAAAAGPFGGCVAVQQTDTTPNVNTPENIATLQTVSGINAQVAQNEKDLKAAEAANVQAPTQDDQGVAAVDALLSIDSAAAATAGAAGAVASGAATANNTANAGTGKKGKKNKNNANNRRAFNFAA